MTHLVFIGGGHTHAIAIKKWGKQKIKGIEVTLISNVKKTPYSGMLPGLIAGYYDYDSSHINLVKLAQFAQIKLIIDQVIDIQPEQKKVICSSGQIINFDLLSIDIGSTPQTTQIKGADLYGIRAKPVPTLLAKWQKIVERCQAQPSSALSISIIGGGAGGIELALNMHQRLSHILPAQLLTINLIHRGQRILSHQNERASKLLTNILKQKQINLYLNTEIEEIKSAEIITKSQQTINCNYTFVVTNAQPASWLQKTQIETDKKGFILVKDTLQTINYEYIFATGDIASMINYSVPKAGVFAVRQGKPLLHNLKNYLSNQSLNFYKPQQKYLNIIGTGDRKAVAIWGEKSCRSPLLWYLKEWLDFRFMNQFKF